MPEQYLRPTDLAQRWAMNPRTLANWRVKGTGPAYTKIGGAVRYRMSDVLAFEQSEHTEAVA